MGIFTKSLDDLAVEQVPWEVKLEALAAPLAEAEARAHEERSSQMIGKGNQKSLEKAESVLARLKQDKATCIQNLASLTDRQYIAGNSIRDAQGKAAPAETERLIAEQLSAGHRMARALALVSYLNNSFFRPTDQVIQCGFISAVYGVEPHLEAYFEVFKRTFDGELARLRASEPEPESFFSRTQENRELRTNLEFGRELAVQTLVRAAVGRARGEA